MDAEQIMEEIQRLSEEERGKVFDFARQITNAATVETINEPLGGLSGYKSVREVRIAMQDLASVTEQALTLCAEEREKLASALIQSTHNSELTENDRVWLAVAEERFLNLQSGKDKGIPASEFFAKVKEKAQWM